MKVNYNRWIFATVFVGGLAWLGGSWVGDQKVLARGDPPPLQFTDAEYLANGIDPALPDPPNPLNPFNRPPVNFDPTKFIDPLDGSDARSTDLGNNTFEVNEMTGGFNHSGSIIYYTVLATFNE